MFFYFFIGTLILLARW